ncbi:MAG: aromatic amino acid lyase, partial [Saprospiraceae bacterium]|nr:aromatic amino acid lyase [Saprospiraceae bacterium]
MSETIASIRKDCFQLGMDQLTASRSIHLSKHPSYSYLSPKSLAQVANARRCIENILASEHVVYGVNTGFGSLCNQIISSGQVNKLQTNILKSHSVGLGRPVSQCTAKLMLLLKIHSLARGNSGVRPETLHRILWHLKNDIIPLVPRQGSVGASGDLAPLAHLFLPLIGLGYV